VNTKAAVMGTEGAGVVGSERDMLLAALTSGLKQQAGYMPGVDDSLMSEPIKQRGELISIEKPKGSGWYGVDVLSDFCAGYGWVAGSAALWRYMTAAQQPSWNYGDYDVFCHSISAYEHLRGLILDRDVTDENERGVKAKHFTFIDKYNRRRYLENVNFIKPLPTDNWLYPQNVLAKFDLSICAVAMVQQNVVYALYPDDLRRGSCHYTGQTISPVATMRRVFKYMSRGFKLNVGFWHEMAADERMLSVMDIFNVLHDLGEKKVQEVVADIYCAVPDSAYYSSYRDDDDDDYDDY
jgi:hypothetical protein